MSTAPIGGLRDLIRPASPGGRESRRLRAVPDNEGVRSGSRRQLAKVPFIGVLIGLFVLGMAGLLMINTTLQNQAFESRTLNRRATELAYSQAELESKIEQAGATQQLTRRASALGMRPNHYPAFLVVPSGKVIGKERRVTGAEAPKLIVKTPAERAAERAARLAERKAAAERRAAAARAKAAAEAKKVAEAQRKAEAKKAADAKRRAAERAGR